MEVGQLRNSKKRKDIPSNLSIAVAVAWTASQQAFDQWGGPDSCPGMLGTSPILKESIKMME